MSSRYQPNTLNLKVKTPDGFMSFDGVVKHPPKNLWRVTTSSEKSIECTLDHEIYITYNTKRPVCELKVNDKIVVDGGIEVITSILKTDKHEEVFDLINVSDGNKFFANKILVSNCRFVSGDDTLINPLALARLSPEQETFIIDDSRWFREPQANHVYGLAWDPAMGSVQDFASIQVVDFTAMEQVAEWRSNRVSISDQTKMLIKMLYYIDQTLENDPEQEDEPEIYWTMEINGLGLAADSEINHLGEDAFPGILVNEPKRGAGYRAKGLRTGKNNKMAACSFFKRLIESDKLKVYSRPLLREMKNFVRSGGSYAAKSGEHDDLVMSMIITLRLLTIVQDWSDNINEDLNSDFLEDLTIEPMPFIT